MKLEPRLYRRKPDARMMALMTGACFLGFVPVLPDSVSEYWGLPPFRVNECLVDFGALPLPYWLLLSRCVWFRLVVALLAILWTHNRSNLILYLFEFYVLYAGRRASQAIQTKVTAMLCMADDVVSTVLYRLFFDVLHCMASSACQLAVWPSP